MATRSGFGGVRDDSLFDTAGADDALERASGLVDIVAKLSTTRGSSDRGTHEEALNHALAAVADASILRNTRVDIRFEINSGEVVKDMTPMLFAAWKGEANAVIAMVKRAAELTKRDAKHIARSLRNSFNNECTRTPEEQLRPPAGAQEEMMRLLANEFGGTASRLRDAVSHVEPAGASVAASGAGGGSRDGSSAGTASASASSARAPEGDTRAKTGPLHPPPVARTDTERLILVRVDQICEAATKRSATALEKIITGLDRTMLKRLVNRRGSKGYTPLSIAVNAGAYDCAELLLEHAANPDMRPQNCDDVPVLAQAIITEDIDRVRMTELLLAYNADPNVETLEGQTMMELARVRGSRPIRYWLTIAMTLPPVPEECLSMEKKIGLARLRWLEFCLVGQMPAKRQVVAAVSCYFRLYDAKRRGGRPVVLLLPGPPGHGKTMLAKAVARVIQPLAKRSGGELPFATLNCSVDRSAANIFGGDVHTVGKGAGKLTSICGKFHGSPAVIVIDEVDKCSADALKGFYRVFDDGILDNTGGDKSMPEIDCSKHIFILTCNWAQKLIQTRDVDLRDTMDELFDDEAGEPERDSAMRRMGVLLERLSDEVKDSIRATLGNMRSPYGGASAGADALVGRMQTVVPFISLTPEEVTVITALFLEQFKAFMRKPPIPLALGPGKYHGNMRLLFEDAVIDFIAKRYRQGDGVRSVEQEVRTLESMLTSAARLGKINNGDTVVFALRQVYIVEKLYDYISVFRLGDEPSLFDVLAADEATRAEAAATGGASAASAAGADSADETALLRAALEGGAAGEGEVKEAE